MRDISIAFTFIFVMFLIAMFVVSLQFKIITLPHYPSNISSSIFVIIFVLVLLSLIALAMYNMVKK